MDERDIPEGFWRSLCEDADHPFACVDSDQKFTWVNNAFERLVGYSLAELKSRSWVSITDQRDVGGDLASIQAVIDGKSTHYTMSKNYIHKRGHQVPVELTVRRYPPSFLEGLVCFRVEAPLAKATRPELDALERHLTASIAELKRRFDHQERGVSVHVGDELRDGDKIGRDKIGGDLTGGDKRVVSNAAVMILSFALCALACLVAGLFYYVVVK